MHYLYLNVNRSLRAQHGKLKQAACRKYIRSKEACRIVAKWLKGSSRTIVGANWIECQVWLSSWVLALGVSPCACEEEIISLRVGGQSSKVTARGCSLETIAGNEVAVQSREKRYISSIPRSRKCV